MELMFVFFISFKFILFKKNINFIFYNFQDESCLGFFNEETREWECEDKCLKEENGKYCGKTGK